MARPFITTIALVAGVGLTIAGCTTALDSPDADSSTVEAETSSTPADLPEVDSSVLEELDLDAPDKGTDAYIAWSALLGPDGEYAAAAMYQAVIDEFGDVEPYVSIKEGEERHIGALTRQLERMGYEVPDNPYLGEVLAPADLQTAAEAWAEGEIVNVDMYDELLTQTDDETLIRVLENLRRASLESHLPLFELAADNGGSLTPEQMPSNLGASHAGGKRDGHEGQAMRGENRGEGRGPGHRS
jgi:predicted nucleic acid-binding protein